MPSRLIQILILGGLTALVVIVIVLVAWIAEPGLFALPESAAEEVVPVNQATLVPTFTSTPSPLPPTPTSTFTSTPAPTETTIPTAPLPALITPTATVAALPLPTTPTPLPATAVPAESPTPARPPIDFVVVQQRMRTNEENSRGGKVANNCGGDHTIYVQVIDAAGNPVSGVIVGDTYDNVRASSGSDGPGRLKIELWSNTMSLEVQGDIGGFAYTSEQTVPLSTRDEDIPAEWLFEGGYCGSIAECQLRQQTNGLCRGHYSFDVTFQRTW